jgi:hypothetical protein
MDIKITPFYSGRIRRYCQFPAKNGAPLCMKKVTHVVLMGTFLADFSIEVCDDCADYARKHKPQCKTTKSAP